ncbi:19480_t:CDS:2 [Dentiscutata erythropus]|uniref:19480_t:CDS:1 n=1 Tax=Dentiscutata erythropus TaxID=1348616 RepID=A0A9N9EZQ8_9GLOM|nr:19480_t:CDS:2 [Dentiscutata erythropus]
MQEKHRRTMHTKVAIITGANSGVGFGIAQRLLDYSLNNPSLNIRVVLACRNPTRASVAREALLVEYPESLVDTVTVDLSSVDSVFKCCKEIKEKYDRVDLLFCNAGILSCKYLDWRNVIYLGLSNPGRLVTGTQTLVQPIGNKTTEGLGETFACNVFGHYVMVRQLEDLMSVSGDARIIWTGSGAANKDYFNSADYQCIEGINPYESSKHFTDIISVALNTRLNRRHIYSFTTSPGVVATNIVGGHLGWVMDKAMKVGFILGRICGLREDTVTAWNGAYSNFIVATLPIEGLNKSLKYNSYAKPWGAIYYEESSVDGYDEKEATALLNQLDHLLEDFLKKYEIKS